MVFGGHPIDTYPCSGGLSHSVPERLHKPESSTLLYTVTLFTQATAAFTYSNRKLTAQSQVNNLEIARFGCAISRLVRNFRIPRDFVNS